MAPGAINYAAAEPTIHSFLFDECRLTYLTELTPVQLNTLFDRLDYHGEEVRCKKLLLGWILRKYPFLKNPDQSMATKALVDNSIKLRNGQSNKHGGVIQMEDTVMHTSTPSDGNVQAASMPADGGHCGVRSGSMPAWYAAPAQLQRSAMPLIVPPQRYPVTPQARSTRIASVPLQAPTPTTPADRLSSTRPSTLTRTGAHNARVLQYYEASGSELEDDNDDDAETSSSDDFNSKPINVQRHATAQHSEDVYALLDNNEHAAESQVFPPQTGPPPAVMTASNEQQSRRLLSPFPGGSPQMAYSAAFPPPIPPKNFAWNGVPLPSTASQQSHHAASNVEESGRVSDMAAADMIAAEFIPRLIDGFTSCVVENIKQRECDLALLEMAKMCAAIEGLRRMMVSVSQKDGEGETQGE